MLCERVLIMDRGRMIATGKIDELIQGAPRYVYWRFDNLEAGAIELGKDPRIKLRSGPVAESQPADTVAADMPEAIIADTVDRLSACGIGITAVYQTEPTLEELFLALTGSESLD